MIERPLAMSRRAEVHAKGSFIVAKTGVHPMQVRLRLFLDWGIKFDKSYEVPGARPAAGGLRQQAGTGEQRSSASYAPAVEDGEIPRRSRQHQAARSKSCRRMTRPKMGAGPGSGAEGVISVTNFRNIYSSDLSHRARSVYMYLKDRADPGREVLASD